MELINPELLRLVPGESIQAMFSKNPDDQGEIGFFVRSVSGINGHNRDPIVRQRGGLIKYEDVFLVLTMIEVEGESTEFFDIWWNYHAAGAEEHFRKMAQQKSLTVYFYTEAGKQFSIETSNEFRKFFSYLPGVIDQSEPWTEVEFDRALRGFCAQSYPKENLWEMIVHRSEMVQVEEAPAEGVDSYPGVIPEELKPFYDYLPTQGHSIKIIPSTFEEKAMDGDPEEFLFPAPVKTVLRCGIRWAKGYPVAPIPFIPGHGLAVPPDDTEY
jgi:hypothetical protein